MGLRRCAPPPHSWALCAMDDLDFVDKTIESWVNKYISQGAKSLSTIEMIGVGVWVLEMEVNNGGFDQYYFNSCGNLAIETVASLKQIGANETASLLEAANNDVPCLPLPEDRDARMKILDQVNESSKFGALENEYYQETEDRIALLAKYLREYQNGT